MQDNVALQATWHAEAGTASALAHHLGRLAVAALHAELRCAPKPGLVTPFDNGSHADMDATTFLRSLFALRGYFVAIAQAGIDNAPFEQLRQLGIAAEVAMLRATGGINTHRGAIFSLGVLTAQAARLRAVHGHAPTGEAVCNAVQVWRDALCAAPLDPRSNGQRARARFQIGGVREQAADGYPLLREIALPSLRSAMQNGATREAALAQTLMQLVAEVDDLNLLHRGAQEGLAYAKTQARGFLAEGGIAQPQWRALARHWQAVRRASPEPGRQRRPAGLCLVPAVSGDRMSTHWPLAAAKAVRAHTCSRAALLSAAGHGILRCPWRRGLQGGSDSTRTAHGVTCQQATA